MNAAAPAYNASVAAPSWSPLGNSVSCGAAPDTVDRAKSRLGSCHTVWMTTAGQRPLGYPGGL